MRAVLWGLAVAGALAVVGATVVGWTFSSRILIPAPYQLFPEFALGPVREVGDGRYEVVLPLPEGAAPPQAARTDVEGRYGLLWEGGGGPLGPVLDRREDGVVRRVEVRRGTPPEAGLPARMDVTLFATPEERGVAVEDVALPGPLGPLPGWWIPAPSPTDRAIVVWHGRRRADRSEALRILPTLAAAGAAQGASVLVSSYRNHDASPDDPSGFFRYGARDGEVADALAALAWLEARGVREVVLVGFSMGGSVALGAFDALPEGAPAVRGIVLDAPLIDPFPTFLQGAERLGVPLPGLVTRLALGVAERRSGLDFAALDRRRTAPDVDVPVLLFAGTGDTTTPIAMIDAFAEALPTPPTYVRLDGVEHVEAWNVGPERYEREVARFLAAVWP